MIKDFVKVTTILDQKQHRNVALYKDFQAEMSEGGFRKLYVTITLKLCFIDVSKIPKHQNRLARQNTF